jgi:hypothetical protein
VAIVRTDIDGHVQQRVFLYVIPTLNGCDIIMGLPWMKEQGIQIRSKQDYLTIGPNLFRVLNSSRTRRGRGDCIQILATCFGVNVKRRKVDPRI